MQSTKLIAAFALLLLSAVNLDLEAATLLVGNKTDDTVDLIEVDSNKRRATLPTGHAPHEIAVSPDGKTAVVTNYGDRETPGSTLTVVDVAEATVERTIDLGRHTRPHGIEFIGSDRVVVTTEGSKHLLTVAVSSGEILQEIEIDQEVAHMVSTTPDGRRAFVANIGSGTVTAVDLAAGKKLEDIATGDGAEGIAVSPDGREVWVGNRAADTVTVIDSRSLDILAQVPCAGFPIRIEFLPDGDTVLVSAARSGEIVRFDRTSRREMARQKLDLSTVPTASRRLFGDQFGESPVPVGIQIAPDGGTAWVAATQADVVVVIDPATLRVENLVQAGQEPDGMAFSSVSVAATD